MSDNAFLQSFFANLINPIHQRLFVNRRLTVLTNTLSHLIPNQPIRGLDIGCGAGELTKKMAEKKSLLQLFGVDILKRIDYKSAELFHYKNYDGKILPFEDNAFEFSYLIDVLHHTDDPKKLLAEAIRVTKHFIIIKDHFANSKLDHIKLHIMDYIGNKSHDVYTPYYYLSKKEWLTLFNDLHLEIETCINKLKIYGLPISIFFGSNLHFIAKLNINRGA